MVKTTTTIKRAILICFLATFFYLFDYFIQTFPSVITHQLMAAFKLDAAGLGGLAAFFFYAYALMQLPGGILLDRLGARRMLTAAVFITAIGVTLFSVTDVYAIAALSRFLIGVGSSIAFISALYLASSWLPKHWFSSYCGILQAMGALGCIIAQAPLALADSYFGWRQTLFVIGIFTFVLIFIFWFFIKDNRHPHYTAHNKRFIKSSFARLAEVSKSKQVWYYALMGAICWVPAATFGTLWGIPFLSHLFHTSPIISGEFMLLFWIALIIFCPLLGYISERTGRRLLPFSICFFIGFISSIVLLMSQHESTWVICIAIFCLGLSTSGQALAFAGIKDITGPKVYGTASGLANMVVLVISAIAQPAVGLLVNWHSSDAIKNGVHAYTTTDFEFGLILLPIAFSVGAFILLTLAKEPRQSFMKDDSMELEKS